MSSQSSPILDLSNLDLDRISAALAGLTRPSRVTLKSLVDSHRDAILAARRRGIGHAEIAAAMTVAGCPITAATLRKYLGRTQIRNKPSAQAPLSGHDIPVADVATRRSLRRSTLLKEEVTK
jgi:hypothetical protein